MCQIIKKNNPGKGEHLAIFSRDVQNVKSKK